MHEVQEDRQSQENTHDRIVRLEERIEGLRDAIERCRKISLGAKIAIAGGAAWFALMLVRILPLDTTAFFAAVTAMLGGVVLLGSNATTWTQTEGALHKAEAMRAELIGSIALRVVSDAPPTMH